MKIQTSKERRTQEQPLVPESYQHPKAIRGHVYLITRSSLSNREGLKYYAVFDKLADTVRLYNLDSGLVWSSLSTFGNCEHEWKDITDKVYLNTDEVESQQ